MIRAGLQAQILNEKVNESLMREELALSPANISGKPAPSLKPIWNHFMRR